ncbi:hypothetical protein L0337_11625 [candidate division KSB1 bacterium]|nr:hypothetical protein [candidate division KSB1 bacterium]
MEKVIAKVGLGFGLSLFLVSGVLAQRDQIPVGTRPLSMGGAFLAVADDGNTIYWNPAGLARMERIQASFMYADLFGIGINNYYASFLSRLYFIPPLTDYLTFGVDWFGIQFGDEELEFNRNQFNFALAFKPPQSLPYLRNFSLGMNVKHLRMGARLENIAETETDANGWGWDFGILYHVDELPYVPGRFNLGLMVHDGGGTQVKHNTDISETIQHQNIRWGMSYRPFDEWPGGKIPISDPVLALDFDERAHVGLEFWLAHTLALRAGWQKDFHTDEKPTLSFGLGIKTNLKDWPEARVDYALTDSPVLPNTTKQFGGSLILKENPRLIRIGEAHIGNVFAALYRSYGLAGASVGTIKIKNVSNDTLKVWVSFQASRYMEPQQADTVIIAPERTIDFPLRANFNQEIINAPDGRLSAEVKANYAYKKNEHVTVATVDFALYGRNSLTWDDPGKAAAFVTYDHPLVKAFVDETLQKVQDRDETSWFSRYNMATALTIFHALQAYGFTYRLDPVTPFPSLADTMRGARYRLDRIQYPAEFLSSERRFGDCDDLSVLYASLLQHAGLGTALVSGPGHIFMMFDTSIPESHSRALPISPQYFIKRNGTLWIPIETTMIPSTGFTEAWMTAAERLNKAVDETMWKVYEVAASQAKYPPVPSNTLPFPASLKQPIPVFDAALQKDMMALEKWKEPYLATFVDSLKLDLTLEDETRIRNFYGALLGQNDDYPQARTQFQAILAQDSTFASAWHNWGNVEFVLGNFANAESLYAKALAHNPFSRGTYLNLAILYQMMIIGGPADSVYYLQKSEEALLKAAQLLEGDAEGAFAILGFVEERTDGKAASFVEKIKERIRKVKDFVYTHFTKYVRRREIRGVALDRHGVKGWGELDQERGELLAWSY